MRFLDDLSHVRLCTPYCQDGQTGVSVLLVSLRQQQHQVLAGDIPDQAVIRIDDRVG